ncbi:MAG: ABC transporter ATP-binding protein [Defluviitaleaceae bacterium]|nr:ABC transporter ATP-binding protein [Defluviitaleaceae bacterium]MCL2273730.1 ABC transporter ATP-binding protein [Defluviitaleaceae bacterium]
MHNVLEITNLHKKYGRSPAVNGVTFSVKAGSIVGLLGPNGSGKTTLIKTIMGLLPSYTGDISITGENGAKHKPGPGANASISYLPDVSHIPTWFTPLQAMQFFADFYADFDRTRAEEMLTAMHIPLRKRLSALSRGMQEKVQLALVMARRAGLYVLDEPIGAVDPASREYILNTIITHHAPESAILLSSHIISDIEPVLDVAIFLQNGKIHLMEEADALRESRGMSLDQLFREEFRHA